MNKRQTIFLAVALITLSVVAGIEARQKEATSAATGLALEVTFYKGTAPSYQPVAAQESSPTRVWYGRFRRVASRQAAEDSLPVRAVNIVTRKEGDGVRINVSVFMGKQVHDKEEPVATYLARENERIVVAELAGFGVAPFEIGIIRVPEKVRTLPSIKNKTESVQVIGLEPNDSTLPSYSLSLKNISDKNIASVEIFLYVGDKRRMVCRPRSNEGKPLIETGAVFKTNIHGAEDAVMTQQGYMPESPQDQSVVIGTVVFDDGTYEGDVRVAAEVKAMRLGDKMQLTQMLTLMRNAMEAGGGDSLTAMENLKRQVSSLRFEENIPVPVELLKDLPSIDRSTESHLQLCIQSARSYVKKIMLNELESLEANLKKAPDKNAFQNWLNATSAKYEQWLSRL